MIATEQIAVRLPQELLQELDALVARGVYESRAAAVRAGVEALAESERRRRLDQAVIEGYQRRPVGAAEREAAVASFRDAILEEPWLANRDAVKSGGARSRMSVGDPSWS